jgi:hypothetical protein
MWAQAEHKIISWCAGVDRVRGCRQGTEAQVSSVTWEYAGYGGAGRHHGCSQGTWTHASINGAGKIHGCRQASVVQASNNGVNKVCGHMPASRV